MKAIKTVIDLIKSKSFLIIVILLLVVANYWQSCNYKNLKKQLNKKEILKVQKVIELNEDKILIISSKQDSIIYYWERQNEKIDNINNADSLLHIWREHLSEGDREG